MTDMNNCNKMDPLKRS